MAAGGDPAVALVDEPPRLVSARGREMRELEERPGLAKAEAITVAQRSPVEPGQGQVLAIGAGERVVAIRPDALDRLDRIEADGLERAAVERLGLAVRVPIQAEPPDARTGDRPLGDAAR
jgi:hypothetical protein